jgi:hypothetical protein
MRSLSSVRAVAALLGMLAWLALGGAVCAQGPGAANGYELLTPQGSGPFPAVVVMHGCDKVYSGATYLGHRMVHDASAASDAEARTRQFFAARLGRS